MARFLVERFFPDGLAIPMSEEGATAWQKVFARNADAGVTWIHSYVTRDQKTAFCVYDGPTPEAIRRAAECSGLPVDRLAEVTIFAPYFYRYSPYGGHDAPPACPGPPASSSIAVDFRGSVASSGSGTGGARPPRSA